MIQVEKPRVDLQSNAGSMTSVSSGAATALCPTCTRSLEAPPPPTPGPEETLHLYAVRLSRLEKVGSAMVTPPASQGQRK